MGARAGILAVWAALAVILGGCSDTGIADDAASPRSSTTTRDGTVAESGSGAGPIVQDQGPEGEPGGPVGEETAEGDDPASATAALAERIDVESAPFEDKAFTFLEIPSCPYPGPEGRIRGLFEGLLPPAVEAMRVELAPSATRLPVNDITILGCALFAPVEVSVGYGLDVSRSPGDFDSYQREFNDPEGLGDVRIETTRSGAGLGGTFRHVCVTFDNGFQSCEVAWSDESVLLTAYAYGPGATELDLDGLQRRLTDQVLDIVETTLG